MKTNLFFLLCAFFALTYCGQKPSTPVETSEVAPLPVQVPIATTEEDEDFVILPFPKHFSIARSAVNTFSGTIDIGSYPQKRDKESFGTIPVLHPRFGCYTLNATSPWDGQGLEDCLYEASFFCTKTLATHDDFVLVVLCDRSALMRPAISVWKTRGDSLDFYTLLNKCFDPAEEQSSLQIDSIQKISASRHRIFGQISWNSWNGQVRGRTVQSWVADWTLPDKFDIR